MTRIVLVGAGSVELTPILRPTVECGTFPATAGVAGAAARAFPDWEAPRT